MTFEEECEMQETWKNSDDKCTFIILHRETFEEKNSNEIEAMIGDTNIFLKEEEGSKLGKLTLTYCRFTEKIMIFSVNLKFLIS